MNVKNILTYLFFLLFCFAFCLQAQSERDSADIVLEMKVLPHFPVGFANCYKGVVSEVIKGKMKDTYLTMTVLTNDTTYDRPFNKDPNSNKFEIGFRKNKTNEEYSVAYITGFVDKNRTSWKIVYVKQIIEEEQKFF
jgi:hypothetical protein